MNNYVLVQWIAYTLLKSVFVNRLSLNIFLIFKESREEEVVAINEKQEGNLKTKQTDESQQEKAIQPNIELHERLNTMTSVSDNAQPNFKHKTSCCIAPVLLCILY